jgi:hypothetical protein
MARGCTSSRSDQFWAVSGVDRSNGGFLACFYEHGRRANPPADLVQPLDRRSDLVAVVAIGGERLFTRDARRFAARTEPKTSACAQATRRARATLPLRLRPRAARVTVF